MYNALSRVRVTIPVEAILIFLQNLESRKNLYVRTPQISRLYRVSHIYSPYKCGHVFHVSRTKIIYTRLNDREFVHVSTKLIEYVMRVVSQV